MRGPGFRLIQILLLLAAVPAFADAQGDNAALAPQPVAPADSQGAYAPQTAASPMPMLSQVYERGNENLILQWKYLENRIDTIEQVASQLPDDKEKALVQANYQTEGFCNDANTQDAQLCLKWYLETKVTQLAELKKAMLQNQDSIANLSTNVYTPNGQALTSPRQAIVPAENLMPGQKVAGAVPRSVPKQVELDKQTVTPANVSAWYVDMTAAPTGGDFAKAQAVSLSNNGSEPEDQYVRDPKGNLQLDQQKLTQAQKDFRDRKGRYELRAGSAGDSKHSLSYEAALKAASGKAAQRQAENVARRRTIRDVATESEKADYRDARNFVVAFYNKSNTSAIPTSTTKPQPIDHRLTDGKTGTPAAQKVADAGRTPGSAKVADAKKKPDDDQSISDINAEMERQKRVQGKAELDLLPQAQPANGGYTVDSVYMDPQIIQDSIDSLIGQQ